MRSPSAPIGALLGGAWSRADRGARQQMIDRGDQRRQLGLIGLQFDAALERAADGDALHLLRNLLERR